MKVNTIYSFLKGLCITGGIIYAQLGYAQDLKNTFPEKGKVGVGTTKPTESLEVVGNIKVSGSISSQTVSTNSLQTSSLLTLNNAVIKGKLGIGVSNPTVELDVLGGARFTGNLVAQNLSLQGLTGVNGVFNTLTINQSSYFTGSPTFSNNASFLKNISLTGKLGVGVTSPSEAVDVLGNIKTSGSLASGSIASGSATFSSLTLIQNSSFGGTVGIGTNTPAEKLHVVGNIKADNSIFSKSLQSESVQTTQLTSGSATFSDVVTMNKLLILNDKLGIGVSAPSESLDVSGNIKASQGIVSASVRSGTGDFSDRVHVAQNLVVDGQIGIGKTSPSYALDVNGTVNATAVLVNGLPINPASATNFTVDQNLTVNGGTTLSALQVTGAMSAQSLTFGNGTSSADFGVGKNLSVSGNSSLTGDLSVGGTTTLFGVNINGPFNANSVTLKEITTVGNTTVGQNLTVNGTSQLTGDLSVSGNIKGSIIEANEFRNPDGTVAFNFQNTVISQTLGIGTTNPVPANYKLAVAGNIIATGLDLKVPSRWPDYVFEPNYKLVSLDELNAYLHHHKHLPDMPSDTDMKAAKNYNVSEMDAKLLEKIEELTLYIIQLEERIKKLEKK